MASYLGHLSFSAALGAVYGSAAVWMWDMDWGAVFLGAGMTTVGGLLPDIDSDSGVPIRELFGLAAVVVPYLLFQRFVSLGLSLEQILVILGGLYLLIRYGISRVFKKFTVHRGIYHSIPALLISGLIVFLVYQSSDVRLRIYLAVGTMLGFLSHLVLDELCSVDFEGGQVALNQFAGSALKLFSPSWTITIAAYALLAGLGYLAARDFSNPGEAREEMRKTLLNIPSTGMIPK